MDLVGKRILVPLDGSALAERALPVAQRLADALKSELVLARIAPLAPVPFDLGSGVVSAQAYQQLADEDLRLAREYLERVAGEPRNRGIPVALVAQSGEPAATLLDVQARMDVGLVVMTSHGRTGLARFALGSVADRLLHHTPVPLLLLRPTVADRADETLAQVIVPLDGSPLSESAVDVVAPLAGRLARRIVLLRVVAEDAPDTVMHDADRYLAAMRDRVITQVAGRDCEVESLVVRGAADEQIIARAEGSRSLVCMATHGRTSIGRWAFGSHADRVVHAAHVPVLLVHPPQAQDTARPTEQASAQKQSSTPAPGAEGRPPR